MLKVSAFYLEKQKSFIPKKIFLSRCQYQNKKALFTEPIFSEGFDRFTNILRNTVLVALLRLFSFFGGTDMMP